MDAAPTLYQIEAHVRAALDDPSPRPDAHSALAPRPRVGWRAGIIPDDSRLAAGLLLLYPIGHRVHLVLTRRAGTLGKHAGQVSLPGGAVDDGETIEVAALREAEEEIGLDTAGIRVLGTLSPLYIPVSNFALHPVVAVLDRRPTLEPAAAEVAHILEVSLETLGAPGSLRHGWRWRGAEAIRVPFFDLGGERVWGATAMVLGELLSLLGADPATDTWTNAGGPRDRRSIEPKAIP